MRTRKCVSHSTKTKAAGRTRGNLTVCDIDSKKQTVNFGWLRADSPLYDLERVVAHEFGHVLGMMHEHNNPDFRHFCERSSRVPAFWAWPPNSWDKKRVDARLFATWSRSIFPFKKPLDPLIQ